ncbi:MAG TPA: NAD(P)H-binding protein [Propionibacteriaceae bacterium]|nr:NAD(P)H-binding protein [Propionibacteriaceae bacterium]
MLVLVVGGTGGLGRLAVGELAARGHSVRVLSRQRTPSTFSTPEVQSVRGDLVSGEGVAAAVKGVDAVLDTVNANRSAGSVMVDGTRGLLAAAANSGVRHVVGIGIVGAEAIAPLVPYYRVKVAQEQVLRAGDVPWTLLRATQFHDFVASMVSGLARLPLLPVPGIRYQPVDRGEVAVALVDAVEGSPSGRLPDFGGPQALPWIDFARSWLRAQGRSQRVVNIPLPTKYGRRLREGALCNPDRAVGRLTFSDWAEAQVQGDLHA